MEPLPAVNAQGQRRQLAKRLLAAGAQVSDVERALMQQHRMDAPSAAALVNETVAERLQRDAETRASASPRIGIIVLGLLIASGSFAGAYYFLKIKYLDGKYGPVDPLFVPGAGIAVVALNMVRRELMKLLN